MRKSLCYGVAYGLAAAAMLSGCGKAHELRDSGIAEFQVGRVEQAKVLLKQALDLDPSDPEALYYMGRALHADGSSKEAIFYYQSCLHVKPGHRAAQEWLSKAMGATEVWGEQIHYAPATRPEPALPTAPDNQQP